MTLEKAKQFYKEGKREEAYQLFRELFTQRPSSADFYTSFGQLLFDLDELDMAEKIAGTATKMPDVTAESWLLCGKIYIKMKNYKVAEGSFLSGLRLDPDHPQLNESMGFMLKNELYRYQAALDHFEKAEQSSRVLGSMGLCYRGVFNEEKAKEYFLKAIEKDRFFTANYGYYLNYILDHNAFQEFYDLYDKVYDKDLIDSPAMDQLKTCKALCLYLENRVEEGSEYAKGRAFYTESNWLDFEYKSIAIMLAYRGYLGGLFEYHRNHPELYAGETDGEIHVVGDSHSLSYAWLNINGKKVIPHLVMGCKMGHISLGVENRYRNSFKAALRALPDGADVILNIGEIDCREYGGIVAELLREPSRDYKFVVKQNVKKYIKVVKEIQKEKSLNITVNGVHAPKAEECKFEEGSAERALRLNVIQTMNKELAIATKNAGMQFMTPYNPGKNGLSSDDIFVDIAHLKPEIYVGLLSKIQKARVA